MVLARLTINTRKPHRDRATIPENRPRAEERKPRETNGTPVIWRGCTIKPCLCYMEPEGHDPETACACGHLWKHHKDTPKE